MNNRIFKSKSGRQSSNSLSTTELNRIAAFLHRCGAKVASMDVQPGRIRIVMMDSASIELDDEETLDAELEAFRKARA